MFRSKNNLPVLLKLLLLIFCRGIRLCGFVIMNICHISRVGVQNALKWTRTKKVFAVSVVVILIFLIMWNRKPFHTTSGAWFQNSRFAAQSNSFQSCLRFQHLSFQKMVESYGAFINHVPPLSNENILFSYVGNGYIAVETETHSYIYLKHGRTLNTLLPYKPIVAVTQEKLPESRSVVLNVEHGLVHRIQSLHAEDAFCITVKSTIYAHRRRPSLLIQEINFSNPSTSSVEFDLNWNGFQSWPSTNFTKFKIVDRQGASLDISVGHALVSTPDDSRSFAVIVAATVLPSKVKVSSGSSSTLNSFVSVRYAPVSTEVEERSKLFDILRNKAMEDLKLAHALPTKKLRQEHINAWLSLWSSGFYISDSLAAGVVNGHQINRTMYYVVSCVRSHLLEVETTESEVASLRRSLYDADRCYGGHHTLQNMKMWKEVYSVEEVMDKAKVWIITLEKLGCQNMMAAGAEGVIQAMMLSYGALRFGNSHLEFATHPSDLHRDMRFRRINYGADTHVNVSVRVGPDNRASLYVSLDRNNLTYHACDAGCLDPPVKLSKEEVSLPVKLTDPVTAILYVTSDLQHMEELRHAIHVHSVDEAPAHEHHVMVMHRHGHKWGGLPLLFWVTISGLIAVFHLFLFKLVYNEYCSPQDAPIKASRYHSSGRRYT